MPPSKNSAAAQREPRLRRVKILLVDEDPRDLANYRETLERQECEVGTCSSYGDAIQRLVSEKFDFVVMDQGRDPFEWRAVVEQATGSGCRTPVLVLARCHDVVRYLEAMQLGAVDYLEKPLSASQLLGVVRAHLPRHFAAA